LPPTNPPARPPDRKHDGHNFIEVTVEKKDPSIGSDLGWVTAPGVQITETAGRGRPIWSGDILLPEAVRSGQYRLAIREFEQFYGDDFSVPSGKKVVHRLVYLDVLEI
jgi:hypothetical protein